ncbi:MAG TPA: hypothetical protein VK826_16325, partial [Bacteroidia bacterium]|nr:hypothetical protein [Bacteroidia bacterium]
AMVENGTWKKTSLAYRLLFYLEKKMSHRAQTLIACSPFMQAYAESKYGLRNIVLPVKPACTNLETFHPSLRKNKTLLEASGLEDKIVCVYAGKLGGIYLDQEVFSFFAACISTWGGKFRALLLTNTSAETIDTYCRNTGLNREVVITRFVPHAEVAAWIGLGDFAFTPVKPVPTKKCCTPIKDGEYWALGLPVVITPNISGDSELIASHRCGAILDNIPGTGYATAVSEIAALLSEDQNELTARCRNLAQVHRNFNIAEKIYRQIYG